MAWTIAGGPVLLALRALGLRGVWEHVQQRDGAAQPMPRTQEEQAQVVQPGQPAASLIGNGAITPIQEHIKRWLQQIGEAFKVVYCIFDGELGHNDAMPMVRQVGLHLVSKLR